MKVDLSNFKNKFKKIMGKKNAKLIAAVLLVVVVGIGFYGSKTILGSKTSTVQNTAQVKKGNLKITVTGSGAITSTNVSKLNAQIGTTVTKVNNKAGDIVKKGDVIAELDDTDYQSSLANTENSVVQSQISAQSSYDDYNNLSIKAPFSGQVSSLSLSVGDKINAGGTVLTLSDTSKLKVLLTYNASDAAYIAVGQSADVYLTSLMESISGTVTYVSNQGASTASGGSVYSVEITMNNPGAVTEGCSASADICTSKGSVSSIGTSTINYVNKHTITSTVSGTVQNIYVNQNQNVSSGAVLIKLKSDEVVRAKQLADLKVAASNSQLASSIKSASKYKIVAACDGTVTAVNFKVGDTVKAGDEFADVYNPNEMQFDVSVDELDVAKLEVGQKVNITLDAISSTKTTPMEGQITKVAVVGTSSNGVTTYPVTIQFTGDVSKLKGGMNANAEIVVEEMKDVLYVPLEAVTTVNGKSFVWVKGTGKTDTSASSSTNSSKSTNKTSSKTTSTYYSNAVRKEVTVGENTDSFIVIKSGLSEGDTVILPETKTSTSTTSSSKTSTRSSGGAGMGGPGGGM
ncbi:MAG: efflux RND transporter periplasmic adaptor subunit [Solirubrobacterales bacterium]